MIHIPHSLESKYRFITLAAQRCGQLMRGATPRVSSRSLKPTTIAQEEVLAGLVEEAPPETSPRPMEVEPAPGSELAAEAAASRE